MITGRDVVLGVLPLFHVYGLNAVLGQVLRQHARLVLVDGFDPEGSPRHHRGRGVSVLPVAPPVFAYWMQVPGLEDRLGPVRMILSGSAPLSPELTEAFTARTGLSIHQGYGLTEASPVVTSTLCSTDPRPAFGRRGAARHRDPAGRRARPAAGGRGRRRRSWIRGDEPLLRLLARSAPTDPMPRAGGPPATSATSTARRPVPGGPAQGAGDRLRLQRLPERGRGRDHRAGRGRRGGRDRRGRPGHRRGGRRLREAARPRSHAEELAERSGRTARAGWPGSSSRRSSTWSTPSPRPSPGRCRRAGCGRPSGAGPWGCWSDRRAAGPPLRQARLPPVRRRAGGDRPGVRRPRRVAYDEVDITTDPELQPRFGEQIPVTFVDGAQHDFWRVDETRLRAALSR